MFNLVSRPRGICVFMATSVIAMAVAMPGASAQEQQRSFDIPAQLLSSALIEFSRQSDVMVVADPVVVSGVRAPALRGSFSPADALSLLLAGSGLTASRTPEGGFVLADERSPKMLGAADAAAPSENSEEVIVTARKREETVRDVPASITALGGRELDGIGAEGFDDFVRLAPGLTMVPTSTNPNFSIRGISTSTTLGTTQAPIALYIDDTPTQDPFVALSSTNLYLADISRVEVLRGPQGTLFGSGSLSGTIRVITRKPDPGETYGYVEGGLTGIEGGDLGTQIEAMANISLGDSTALRVVGYDRRAGGYIDNALRDEVNANDSRTTGGRLALLSDLTDNLSVTGSFIYQIDKASDGARSFYTSSQGSSRQWASLVPDDTRFETKIGNLLVGYDLGWATLTSSSSYLTRNEATHLDASPDLSPLLGVPGTPSFSDNKNESENFVEEVRLTSQLDGPVSFVLGAYYSNAQRHTRTFIRAPALEAALDLPNVLSANLHSTIKETALFGEVTWSVTDKIELAAGLRVFHNEVRVNVDNSGLLIGPPVILERVNEDDSYTPRFTATWKPSEDLTIYAQAAKGYRLGQANVAAGPPIYESDTLWNFEIGAKGIFFDDRLRLNLAVFNIQWDNLQVGLRPSGTVLLYTGNAGAARSVGLEAEADLRLTDEFSFKTSLALTDARLTESIPNLPQPSGVLGVSDGDRMPGAPRFTMSSALSYEHEFGDGSAIRARLDHQYVGRSYNTFTTAGALALGDFHVVNLSVGFEFGNTSMDLFVKNIGDSDGIANANFDFGLDVLRGAWRVPPRSIGFAIRQNF